VSTSNVIGRVANFNICSRSDVLSNRSGLLLLKDFMEQLQLDAVVDSQLHVKERERGYSEGQAIIALICNMISGGECLSDLNVLRGDPGTMQLLGLDSVIAPTTAGEFLRKFQLGDIHDLARINLLLQERVRPLQEAADNHQSSDTQSGCISSICTIDLDSSIYEQASSGKQGSCKAYNGEIGYHPLFAFWDEQEELLFSHLRRGSAHTCKTVLWFLDQTLKRVPQGSTERKTVQLRADSGFYGKGVVAWCERHDVTFGITADQTAPLMAGIIALPEDAWHDLEKYAVSQVAELSYCPTGWSHSYRYVVKRELAQNKQGELYFRYHVLVTNNLHDNAATVLEWHLGHARMENYIKEHKSGFNLEKLPTRCFHANWAYLLIGQLAFNLVSWFKRLVLPPRYRHATLKTILHHVFNLAGKIVHTGRRFYLIISQRYRYLDVWRFAIQRLAQLKVA
jgi:hypothetical protein